MKRGEAKTRTKIVNVEWNFIHSLNHSGPLASNASVAYTNWCSSGILSCLAKDIMYYGSNFSSGA
jgi:hypothetical protein